MRLTPLDLRQTEYRVRLRGFDPLEVQHMMELAAGEIETLIRENQSLRQELEEAIRKLSENREKEMLLKDTLMEAQRTRSLMQETAQKEAEQIIADAELRARALLSETHKELNTVKSEIQQMRNEKVRMRASMAAALSTFEAVLESDEASDKEAETDARLHFLETPIEKPDTKVG